MVRSYKAGRRYIGGFVIFLLLMMAADAVNLGMGRKHSLISAVRMYAKETAQPSVALAVGTVAGILMVVLLGYGPLSPVRARQHRENRMLYGQRRTVDQVREDSVRAGESRRATEHRVKELVGEKMKGTDPYMDALPGYGHESVISDRREERRKQMKWLAGAGMLWAAWGGLAADVLQFYFRGSSLAKDFLGVDGPGTLMSFCISALIAHLTGWGPHFAELELDG